MTDDPNGFNPRDDHGGDPTANANELKDLNREIDRIMRAQHDGVGTDAKTMERLARMQRQYVDLVAGNRKALGPFEMMDWATEYFSRPEVMEQHPALAEVSDGRPEVMAQHAVSLMCLAQQDGHDLTVGQAGRDCEEAFTRYINQNGEDRFRP